MVLKNYIFPNMAIIHKYRYQTIINKIAKDIPFLTPKEQEMFNFIGVAGRFPNGENVTQEKYLNTLGKGKFKIQVLDSDDSVMPTKDILIIQVL